MNVIFITPECFPFTKDSCHGDNVFTLARVLEKSGCNVKIIMPRYGSIEPSHFYIERLPAEFKVKFNNSTVPTFVYKGILPDSFVNVFLIESQTHFSNSKETYLNSPFDEERFNYFSCAALNIVSSLNFGPEIMHTFNSTMVDTINKTKIYTDLKNTPVILNTGSCGIDWETYNPEKDFALKQNYSKEYFTIGKRKCKEELLENIDLEKNPAHPLIGIVTRTHEEAELKLLNSTLDELKNLKLPVVTLIKEKEKHWTDYDYNFLRKILAGSDFLLNLNKNTTGEILIQMAMRYGSIPITCNSSQIKEIISDIEDLKDGNGFIFNEYTIESLIEKVIIALKYYKNKEFWTKIVKQTMGFNSDSLIFVKKYIELYETLIKTKLTTVKQNVLL